MRSARWYSSWILVISLVPVVCLYAVWIPLTCSGQLKAKRKKRKSKGLHRQGVVSYQNNSGWITTTSVQNTGSSNSSSSSSSIFTRSVDDAVGNGAYRSQSTGYIAVLDDDDYDRLHKRGDMKTSVKVEYSDNNVISNNLHSVPSYLRMEHIDWIDDQCEQDDVDDEDEDNTPTSLSI